MASDFRLKEQLPNLTSEIVKTYEDIGTINHLGHCPLPSYDEIIRITDDIREVIYPGYLRRQNLHTGNINYYIGNLVDSLHDRMTAQIANALRHEDRVHKDLGDCGDTDADYEAKGQAITLTFLESIPKLRRILAKDVLASYNGDPACKSLDEVIFCYPGLKAITVFRISHQLQLLGVPFIPRMMSEWAHQVTGIDIHPGAQIDEYFFIDHGTGVVIGETCQIGRHVKLYQGVTLGALSFATDVDGNVLRGLKRHPTIEDNVVIYANATVLGGKNGHRKGLCRWLQCLVNSKRPAKYQSHFGEAETSDA